MSRLSTPRRIPAEVLVFALGLGAAACGRDTPKDEAVTDSASAVASADSLPATKAPADTLSMPTTALPPLDDSIAQRLVFAPVVQTWFVAAARSKKLYVDLGRIDVELKKEPSRIAAYKRAVEARSPVAKGTRFRLRGPWPWGADTATVSGFDQWNGRIVATLLAPARVDSIAAITDPLVVAAERLPPDTVAGPLAASPPGGVADSSKVAGAKAAGANASTPVQKGTAANPTGANPKGSSPKGAGAAVGAGSGAKGDSAAGDTTGTLGQCGNADTTFTARLTLLADSVETVLRSGDQPIYPRFLQSLRSRKSTAQACFGEARGIIIVTYWAGDYEWVRERALLVGDSTVRVLGVRDLRFRAHEVLHALDADGDGVDDIAVRAWTPRGGGTSVLRLVDGARLERLASGFAWER